MKNRNSPRLFLGVLGFILLAIAFSQAWHSSNDFECYYRRAWIPLLNGDLDIYRPFATEQGGYYYSPFFALIGAPFGLLSWGAAKVLWFLLCLASGIQVFRWARVLSEQEGGAFPRTTASLALLLVALLNNLLGQALSGNVSLPILFLCLAGFVLHERGKIMWGALCWALAVNFKIYPVFLLLAPCMSLLESAQRARAFKFLALFGAWSLLLLLAPALWLGWGANLEMHRQFVLTVSHYGPQTDFGRPPFQSLPALFTRLSRALGLAEAWAVPVGQAIVAACGAGWLWFRRAEISARGRWISFAGLVALMAQFSPASWVHHMGVNYFPLLALLLADLEAKRQLPNFRRVPRATWGLLVFIALYALTTEGVVGKVLNDQLENANLPTLGVWILIASFACRAFDLSPRPRST